VRRIVEGSAIAGLVVFAVSAGMFAVSRFPSDDLSRGILLTFIGLPLLVLMSLLGGFLAAIRSRRVIGVMGSVVAAVGAVLLAAIVAGPLHGLSASSSYLVLAGFAAISTAAGHLIGAVGVPQQVDA
jgi:hypothetical protein